MADSEKEKLFQKHSQRVQEQVDAIVKQKERIRKQEEADRAFSEKVAKAGGWGGMASGQKMRLLETSLWKMQDDLIDKVEQAQRDLQDMDYIRKIWKIRDKAKNANSIRSTNSVVAKALNSVGARNGHNAIRMANSKFKPGDVVYCDYNQQVYAVLGSYDDKVSVRNLLNLEYGSQTVREASLKEYPWKATDKNYPYYEKLAKKFAKR